MARLSLSLPAALPYATELDVRITDLNYGGHLGNDAMLSLIHEARHRFLVHHGMSERDVAGTELILADVAIVYRSEAFAGDRLRFQVGLADITRVACDLCYRVTRPADQKLVAEAKTGLVFLDPASRRPTAVPEAVRRLLPGAQAAPPEP